MSVRFIGGLIIFIGFMMIMMMVSSRLIPLNKHKSYQDSQKYIASVQVPINTANSQPELPNTPFQSQNIPTRTIKDPNAVDGSDLVTTSNRANLKYYYYIPNRLLQNTGNTYPVLILIPGITEDAQSFTVQAFKDFAQREGFVIVTPTFASSQNDFNHISDYQHPEFGAGNALITIIDKLQDKGINPGKFYILGISTGAQFALKFTMLHPDLVKACVSHSEEERIIPATPDSVKYFITVRTKDDNSTKNNAKLFYYEAKKLNMAVLYKEYNTSNKLSAEQINDSLEFFRQSQFL